MQGLDQSDGDIYLEAKRKLGDRFSSKHIGVSCETAVSNLQCYFVIICFSKSVLYIALCVTVTTLYMMFCISVTMCSM